MINSACIVHKKKRGKGSFILGFKLVPPQQQRKFQNVVQTTDCATFKYCKLKCHYNINYFHSIILTPCLANIHPQFLFTPFLQHTLVYTYTLFLTVQESSYYVKGTNAFFLERSALSTLPYGIDDPQTTKVGKTNRLDLPELIVDLYNAAKSANAVKGSRKPKSAPIVATNWSLQNDER